MHYPQLSLHGLEPSTWVDRQTLTAVEYGAPMLIKENHVEGNVAVKPSLKNDALSEAVVQADVETPSQSCFEIG